MPAPIWHTCRWTQRSRQNDTRFLWNRARKAFSGNLYQLYQVSQDIIPMSSRTLTPSYHISRLKEGIIDIHQVLSTKSLIPFQFDLLSSGSSSDISSPESPFYCSPLNSPPPQWPPWVQHDLIVLYCWMQRLLRYAKAHFGRNKPFRYCGLAIFTAGHRQQRIKATVRAKLITNCHCNPFWSWIMPGYIPCIALDMQDSQ